MMDFAEFSQQTAKQINQELQRILNDWKKETEKTAPTLLPLVDKFIDSCQGGKRLRGVLVVLGYELGRLTTDYRLPTTVEDRRPKTEDIIKIAVAYEIFHTAILAHDDIIDQSPLRRGQPSLYQALGGNHHGLSQAICLGDAGFFLAERVIAETNFPDLKKIKALQWFFQTMLDTTVGQMLDVTKQDPVTTAKLKTAKYSMIGPLVLGAILGKAKKPHEINLEKFGENLGIAFQIKDDILDSEASIWGGNSLAKKAAEKYKNLALKVLPKITKDKEMSKLLEQMAEYLVERKK